ncbi:MAG: hypothetical protein LKF31_07525 [Muribaculaceae bacterium]|nr:hypothetical protein [Muribaculaceae bacterium]
MQRGPIEEIEKEETELTAEIKALEAECHVDRLRSSQGAFVPYVFGTGAVALVVSTIVNFFSNAIWIEIFPLISAFMDLWMMIAFYGAMKKEPAETDKRADNHIYSAYGDEIARSNLYMPSKSDIYGTGFNVLFDICVDVCDISDCIHNQ